MGGSRGAGISFFGCLGLNHRIPSPPRRLIAIMIIISSSSSIIIIIICIITDSMTITSTCTSTSTTAVPLEELFELLSGRVAPSG